MGICLADNGKVDVEVTVGRQLWGPKAKRFPELA